MSEGSVRDRVKAVFLWETGCEPEKLLDEATFSDIGMDSLDVVEVVMELERRFDVSIDDEEALKCRTLGDAIALVERITPAEPSHD